MKPDDFGKVFPIWPTGLLGRLIFESFEIICPSGVKRLEDSLGTDLLDHGRRPMTLTPQGEVFLRHTDDALRQVRQSEAALASGTLVQTRALRLGLIEDFAAKSPRNWRSLWPAPCLIAASNITRG